MTTLAEPCELTPGCEHGRHDPAAHPCGRAPEPPGSPCRLCGQPVPLTGACPHCWAPIESIVDARALFLRSGLDLDVARALRERDSRG